MAAYIQLGDLTVEVVLKDIKNIHLRVYPPDGRVRISAPRRTDPETIRRFALSKIGWIKKQQERIKGQEALAPRAYQDGERHIVWGQSCRLKVIESPAAPAVELSSTQLILRVRPGTSQKKKQALVEAWYRQQLRQAAALAIARWEPLMGVKVKRFFVRQMKTRWGSCNPRARSIRLNTGLARKPAKFLEYVVVHELAHLIEPSHNARFVALMDRFMPGWKSLRAELNR